MQITMEEAFLTKPITSLQFSDAFKHMAVSIGFASLADVLGVHASVLLKKPLFTYEVYRELIAFLRQHNVLHLLKS